MANNTWPSWLNSIGFPTPGVGDLHDLKFSTGVGEGGKWIGFVNTGWFYHNSLEQYNYVLVGTQTVTGLAGTLNTASTSLSYRPAWGPIMLTGSTAVSGQYTIHNNSYKPAVTRTWIQSSTAGYYYSTIPTSSIVVGVRDLTILPMGEVSASGYLLNDKLYWVDRTNSDESLHKVWIKPKQGVNADQTYFVDFLYFAPILKMREIVVQEPEGIQASYHDIDSLSVIRGPQSQAVTYHASGYLQHTLTDVNVGDWVVMEYYVRKSYVVRNHQAIDYYTSSVSGDVVTINYETSVPDLIPPTRIQSPRAETLNFNPLYADSYRAGYLFHTNPAATVSGYWTVGSVSVNLEKDVVCSAWNEYIKGTCLVLDRQGLPVPWYPVSLSVTATATSIAQYPSSSTGTTDGRGEIHFIYQPATGTTWFYASATANGLTSTATCLVKNQLVMIPRTSFFAGHVNLHVSKEFTPRRYWRTYVNHVMLDGIPRKSSSIILKSKLASIFEYNNTLSNQYISVPIKMGKDNTNVVAGLSSKLQIGYLPQPGDELVAYVNVPRSQSKILKVDSDD